MKKNYQVYFIDEFEKVVSRNITKDQMREEIKVDMEININDVNDKLYNIIKQFAPFGPKNPNICPFLTLKLSLFNALWLLITLPYWRI